MSWLFRNENMRKPLVNGLVAILESNKDNPRIQLGWCITVREILQQIIQKTDFSIVVHDDEFIGLVKCIPNLFLILDTSSKDMPRRLSVMAADCIILLSKCASDRTILSADSGSKCTSATDVSFPLRESYQLQEDVEEVSISGGIEISSKEHLLWEQLDILLNFVLRLKKWNQDSRPLYAKGLHQIAKCLENLATLRDSIISQDGNDFVVPTEVLSSYWNRYSLLMLTDASAMRSDPQAELENWIEGLKVC
ncbi:hypothetical protein KP509_1Z256500 [Ceratopteris richardii]|nr:hypothetical protein KP509_1Z256500 [Ceratopteris richardii]